MTEPRIVYIIDDEEAVRASIFFLLEACALSIQSFSSADKFLAMVPSLAPGCILTDIRMPGMNGLDLLRQIRERNLHWPVVVMTAYGAVSVAVQALKAGARDFIEKPFPGHALIDAVLSALQTIDQTRQQTRDISEINGRITTLTPREREVLEQLMTDNQNKAIAHNLGMSPRTVEVHRARIMGKMQAHSLSALVRMVMITTTHAAR